jgi:hypothetical protein
MHEPPHLELYAPGLITTLQVGSLVWRSAKWHGSFHGAVTPTLSPALAWLSLRRLGKRKLPGVNRAGPVVSSSKGRRLACRINAPRVHTLTNRPFRDGYHSGRSGLSACSTHEKRAGASGQLRGDGHPQCVDFCSRRGCPRNAVRRPPDVGPNRAGLSLVFLTDSSPVWKPGPVHPTRRGFLCAVFGCCGHALASWSRPRHRRASGCYVVGPGMRHVRY